MTTDMTPEEQGRALAAMLSGETQAAMLDALPPALTAGEKAQLVGVVLFRQRSSDVVGADGMLAELTLLGR